MNIKTVKLERARDKEGRLGSFGFSVLGGHGTKYPAVVCEVENGGPAHLSKMVQVGDRLLSLNGEELMELTSKDLVQRIRMAPSPSEFVMGEDEPLREQVLALLRKQERRAAAKRALVAGQGEGGGGGGTEDIRTHHKKPSLSSLPGEERRKKKIIEVEPSVNIDSGPNADIVQVRDNKIIRRLADPPLLSPDHIHPRSSREGSPFRSHASPGRHHSPSPSTGSGGTGSPRRQRQRKTLEQQTAIGTQHVSDSTHSGLDSVSLQSASSGGSGQHEQHTNSEEKVLINDTHTVTKGLNGEVRSLSDSSGINSYTETPNEKAPTTVVSSESSECIEVEDKSMESTGEVASPSGDQDSGISLQIPSWKGPLMLNQKPRSSLAEEILVTELEQQSLEQSASEDCIRTARDTSPTKPSPLLKEATPPVDGLPAIPESPRTPKTPDGSKRSRTSSGSSSKRKSNPYSEAVTLARRLYMLDGFKKSEIAEKLSEPTDIGQIVGKEYLRFFEFENMSLVESLRQFLSCFSLTGESQERERIMVHFSDRYFECNPGVFPTVDVVHGMTVALLLLNTDLHSDHGSQKMSFSQFVNNLQGIGVQLPREVLRTNYESIRKVPLEWATDDVEDTSSNSYHMKTASGSSTEGSVETERTYHVTIPGTFVEVEMAESVPLYKEGFVLRKNIMEGPHKKVARGKRTWKQYYAYLKGFLLYFGQPQGELHLEDTSSAISVCHCLAMGASDYHKKSSVFRVTTSDWQSFLLQAASVMDMQQWIGAINKAAARYSSPPLAAPISSITAFQRPTFPLAPTKNNLDQQIGHHEAKMKSIDFEVKEHQAYKPKSNKAKHSQLQAWFDKYEFLQYEVNRFNIYFASLTSDVLIDYNAPLPSGLVPSPSISTLATSGTDRDSELYKGMTPPHSPLVSRHKFGGAKNSPLTSATKKKK